MPGRTSPRRHSAQAGIGRAALVLGILVVAAALVLVGGALRSGPSPADSPSAASVVPTSTRRLATPPAGPTLEPTLQRTAEPSLVPGPTQIEGVRGEFVGALGIVETCPVLYLRRGVFELVLPDEYRSRVRGGRIEILDAGAVIASEGDLLGVDGRVRDGGSGCMTGPQLHVSRIVEVVSRAKP